MQIESFVPFWEWDLPKKKKSKKKDGKGKEKAEGPIPGNDGGAFIEEFETSGDSRPQSRSARIEEVPE